MELKNKIENKTAATAIVGMGYVGLPHAAEIAGAGMSVIGLDVQEKRVVMLNRGESYISDVSKDVLERIIAAGKFKASADFSLLAQADVIIICVPTPLDKYKIPDISYITAAANEVKKYLRRGQLVILESTTYPGTTEEVLLPLFEEAGLKCGRDFYLAFAPERIDPGNKMPLAEIPKVVGGITPECTDLATAFYSQFLKHVHPVSSAKAAEMTKILENVYRLINISAINELAMLCGRMGLDIWEVVEAAKTKPYGFQAFYPSPRVGGHCIPLDPFYLSWKSREYNFWTRFIELAGEINDQMPTYTVSFANSILNYNNKPIKGARILIFGAAYKKDIGDARESAVYDIVPNLMRKGAQVDFYDPFVKELTISKNNYLINNPAPIKMASIDYTPEILKNYDLVLILTDHSKIDYDELAENAPLVADTRNAIKSRGYKNVFHFGVTGFKNK